MCVNLGKKVTSKYLGDSSSHQHSAVSQVSVENNRCYTSLVCVSIIKTGHKYPTAYDISRYIVLQVTGRSRLVSKLHGSMAQHWILRPQKCQNFHVVTHTQKDRHRLNFRGLCLKCTPTTPEKYGPHAIVCLFPFEKISAEGSEASEPRTIYILPHHR